MENCGIAWPNPGMWWQGQQQFHDHSSPRTEPADPEAHAHSPRRHQVTKENVAPQPDTMTFKGLMAPPPIQVQGSHPNHPTWSSHEPVYDPFTGAANPNTFYKAVATRSNTYRGDITVPYHSRSTSTSHDESMPDYSRPLSPASSRHSYSMPDYSRPVTIPGSRRPSELAKSDMKEYGLSRLESMLQTHQDHDVESQFNDMIASFSPRKNSSTSGISAPSNTRVNSAANTPPFKPNLASVAAQDRASSYSGHPRSVSVTIRDPPPNTRQGSYIDTKPSLVFPTSLASLINDNFGGDQQQLETVIKKTPAEKPKGRKEGRTSEVGVLDGPVNKTQRKGSTSDPEGKENIKNCDAKISDGKRKRSTKVVGSKIALEDRLANHENSSPTGKASKIGRRESPSKTLVDLTNGSAEGLVARAPLGELENRF